MSYYVLNYVDEKCNSIGRTLLIKTNTLDFNNPIQWSQTMPLLTSSFWMASIRLRACSTLPFLPVIKITSLSLLSLGRSMRVSVSSRIYNWDQAIVGIVRWCYHGGSWKHTSSITIGSSNCRHRQVMLPWRIMETYFLHYNRIKQL